MADLEDIEALMRVKNIIINIIKKFLISTIKFL